MTIKILNSLGAEGIDNTGDMLSVLSAAEISITGATIATIGRMHVCSGTAANYTINLPAVSGNAGKLIGFRMSAALTKIITLDGSGSELINSETTMVMWAKESVILLCDGTQWAIVTGKTVPTRAYLKANAGALFASGAFTLININTAVETGTPDMGSTADNRIKILRKGTYLVRGSIQYNNTNTNTANRVFILIYKNGVQVAQALSTCYASTYFLISTTAILPCVATDYIQLYAYFSAGSYTTYTILSTTETSTADTSLSLVEL